MRTRPRMDRARTPSSPSVETLESRLAMSAVAWTGAGGDNLWSNAANWSTGVVPGLSSDVTIASTTESFSVVLDAGPARVKSLFVNERLVVNRGVNLSVLQAFDAGPDADLRINGLINWAAGEWENGATVAVNPGGLLNIGSTSNPTTGQVTIGTDVTNNGRFAWRGGIINLAGSVTNQAFKAMDIASPMSVRGDGLITNFGLLRRGGLASSTTTIDVDFNNGDRVRVLRGTLALGAIDPDLPSMINLGDYTAVNSNANVVFQAPTLHRDSVFGGRGQYVFGAETQIFRGVNFFNGAVFEEATSVYIDPGGARFLGTATLRSSIYLEGTLRVDGVLTATDALIEGDFPLVVGGTVNLNASDVTTDLTVLNPGRINSTGASLIDGEVISFGTLTVATGTLTMDLLAPARSGEFNNRGTLIMGSAATLAITGAFQNSGVFDTTITSGSFGRVQVSGDLELGGTLRARFAGSGFSGGSTFGVIQTTGGARTGTFASFVPINAPGSLSPVVLYSATTASVRLT